MCSLLGAEAAAEGDPGAQEPHGAVRAREGPGVEDEIRHQGPVPTGSGQAAHHHQMEQARGRGPGGDVGAGSQGSLLDPSLIVCIPLLCLGAQLSQGCFSFLREVPSWYQLRSGSSGLCLVLWAVPDSLLACKVLFIPSRN